MADMFGLPVATGPQDLLRNGFSNAEHEMKAPHPVQGLDKKSEVSIENGLLSLKLSCELFVYN
jgi:hypothetical protein